MRKGGTGIKDDYIQIESLTDGRLENFSEKYYGRKIDRRRLIEKNYSEKYSEKLRKEK